MKNISPLLPIFIAGFAADSIVDAWHFVAVIGAVVLAYWLGIRHEFGDEP